MHCSPHTMSPSGSRPNSTESCPVASIVLAAASDLTGQVQTEAFPELLHRLAHYRLEIGVVPVNAADRLDSRCPQRGNAACR